MLLQFLGPMCKNKNQLNNDKNITNDFTYVLYD